MDIYLKRLKSRGLKLTSRRIAIVKIFIGSNSHLTPEEVWKRLSNDFKRCGLPSVYRNLEAFVDCGVLTRIQQFDRKKHYGLCTAKDSHHHHHITCIRCGKVEEIEDCAVKDKKKIKGYRVYSHYMQVNGVCSDCVA
jgi:Fur family transcriptional regulator, ferric uptake regulator